MARIEWRIDVFGDGNDLTLKRPSLKEYSRALGWAQRLA